MFRALTNALIALAFAVAGAAHAADIPIKAPPPYTPQYPSRCGFYYGVNAEAGAGTVTNSPVVGATVIGGSIGGLLGYACVAGSIPWFAEVIVDAQNLNGGTGGLGIGGPVHVEERVAAQTNLIPFLNPLGFGLNQSNVPNVIPMLPPGASIVGTAQPYVYAALNEDDISAQFMLHSNREWLLSPEVGLGMLNHIKGPTGAVIVADTWAGVELQSNSLCIGAPGIACPKLATRFKVGVSFKD